MVAFGIRKVLGIGLSSSSSVTIKTPATAILRQIYSGPHAEPPPPARRVGRPARTPQPRAGRRGPRAGPRREVARLPQPRAAELPGAVLRPTFLGRHRGPRRLTGLCAHAAPRRPRADDPARPRRRLHGAA